MSDCRFKIGNLLQRGPGDPRFQVEGVAPTNHSSSQKTRLNVFIWYINLNRSFYRFVTIHACDRQTDGRMDRQTELSSLDCICIPCSAVKTTFTKTVIGDVVAHLKPQKFTVLSDL